MVFKMNLLKIGVLGVMLLLCLDVIQCLPFTNTPGVGIQDYTGTPITAHCQSKDDDLGTRTMKNKEIWTWRFKPDVYGSTLYWCEFQWAGRTACMTVWDIDTAPRYDASINDWRVLPGGFYMYDTTKSVWKIRHAWSIGCAPHHNSTAARETESVKPTNVSGTTGS